MEKGQRTSRKTWQYKTISAEDFYDFNHKLKIVDTDETLSQMYYILVELDLLGAQGWELVSTELTSLPRAETTLAELKPHETTTKYDFHCVLKRETTEEVESPD